jgi:hypothetical protein
MDQLTNHKHKNSLLISNNIPLSRPTQINDKSKYKKKKCNECNKRRKTLDESHQICHICYKMKNIIKPSGNKVIDDFIRKTQISLVKMEGKMEYVPYKQFKNVEFIAEGGFSKIYKATWIDGPIKSYRNYNNKREVRLNNYTVVLKKLNDSNSITLKELNEVQILI